MWARWSRCMDNYCCEIIVQWKAWSLGLGGLSSHRSCITYWRRRLHIWGISDNISNNFRYFLTPSSVSFWEYIWQISLHHGQFCTQGQNTFLDDNVCTAAYLTTAFALLFLSFWVVLPYIVDQIGNQVSWFPQLRKCHLGSFVSCSNRSWEKSIVNWREAFACTCKSQTFLSKHAYQKISILCPTPNTGNSGARWQYYLFYYANIYLP